MSGIITSTQPFHNLNNKNQKKNNCQNRTDQESCVGSTINDGTNLTSCVWVTGPNVSGSGTCQEDKGNNNKNTQWGTQVTSDQHRQEVIEVHKQFFTKYMHEYKKKKTAIFTRQLEQTTDDFHMQNKRLETYRSYSPYVANEQESRTSSEWFGTTRESANTTTPSPSDDIPVLGFNPDAALLGPQL